MLSPPCQSILNFFGQIGIHNSFAISVIYGTSASKSNANRSKGYYSNYFLPLIHKSCFNSNVSFDASAVKSVLKKQNRTQELSECKMQCQTQAAVVDRIRGASVSQTPYIVQAQTAEDIVDAGRYFHIRAVVHGAGIGI